MSQISQIQTKGIYHGLPVYPECLKGLTAIVTGANGISGYHQVKVLAESPERWTKIYCLSRRPPAIPGGLPKHAEFVSLDFMKEPTEIASVLKEKGVKAHYVFFSSYIQPPPKDGGNIWSDVDELVRVNKLLLSNFLEALPLADAIPKRIMLQTGAKNYGVHLGPTTLPQTEDDPRIDLEPNFYYPQEDVLADFCRQHSLNYSIAMPCNILGAVPDAAMNLCFPLAVYATVCAHLKQPLHFPGGVTAWERPQDQSSAMLNAYLEEWTVLRPQETLGEKFNAVDGIPFTWAHFWPKMAAWYGLEWTGAKEEGLTKVEMPYNLRGYGTKAVFEFQFKLTDWAKTPEVQTAWKEIVEKHDLVQKDLGDIDRIFSFADVGLGFPHPFYFSTAKARKLGFFGCVDSTECMLEVFNDFGKLKMIPPVPMVGGGSN